MDLPDDPDQDWLEVWEGLHADHNAWEWERVATEENGLSEYPVGWRRWYVTYRRLDGSLVRVSADRNPRTGRWFNPHLSSVQPEQP